MTDRGPSPEGALACPFIAFEDDRDARATVPDHRHRCYAEVRPAARANAHQDAFCLSSAFSACPTFLDWARREAAAARPAPAPPPPAPAVTAAPADAQPPSFLADGPAPIVAPPPRGPVYPEQDAPLHSPRIDPDGGPGLGTTSSGTTYHRASRRDWAAPPPWARERAPEAPRTPDPADPADPADPGGDPFAPPPSAPARPPAGAGLAASAAAWLGDDAGPDAASAPPAPTAPPPSSWRTDRGEPSETAVPPLRPPLAERDPLPRGPAWEEPRRPEAFPALRTRVGLRLPSGSPLLLWFVALIGAAVFLFFVPPMLLRMGGAGSAAPTAAPTPSPTPVASVAPTPEPSPTPQVYVVAGGDTLSRIAGRFGISLEQLLAANPAITDPDKVAIGDQLVIPTPLPEAVPDGGSSSAPVVVDDPSASLAPAP